MADQPKLGERYATVLGEGTLYMIADGFVKLRRDDGTAIKCAPSQLRAVASEAPVMPQPTKRRRAGAMPPWDES